MISSLFSSASALSASQTLLDVVGNDLANSNTIGYKSQMVQFSTQFTQQLQAASAPTSTGGGTNPISVGNGVQIGTTETDMAQGTLQSTGNPYDLAVQGNGLFVLSNGSGNVYSRAGSFGLDSAGNLVDPTTGYKVQRTGTVGEASPTSPGFQTSGDPNISVPLGRTIPGQETKNVTFNGNLDSNASPPIQEVLSSGQPLTMGNQPATRSTLLNSLDQATIPYAAGDQIQITGSRANGTPLTVNYTVTGTSADTVGSLLDKINSTFLSHTPGEGATASLDAAGRIILTANQPGAENLTLSLVNNTAASGAGVNFTNFTQTVAGKAGGTATTSIQVYDAQFAPHTVTFTYQKTAANTWNVTASMDAKDGAITGFGNDNTVAGLIFNENGSFQGIAGTSTAEQLVTSTPYTAGKAPATASTLLSSLDQHTGSPYATNDTVVITGTDQDGTPVGPVSVPGSGTLGDVITAINGAYTGATASLDADGNIEIKANHNGQSNLSLRIQDAPTNTGGSTTFAGMSEAERGQNGDNSITFQVANLAGFGTPQKVTLSFGSPGSFSGLTQLGGGTSAAATSQDGFAQGTLQSATVGTDGTITGQFTNGRTQALAQIALATFTNPNGLLRSSNNYFTTTPNSGTPLVSTPGAGSAGTIQSGSLESSNVDIGAEFTQLVAAQRGYQINAQAFSAANQMLQETANLLH